MATVPHISGNLNTCPRQDGPRRVPRNLSCPRHRSTTSAPSGTTGRAIRGPTASLQCVDGTRSQGRPKTSIVSSQQGPQAATRSSLRAPCMQSQRRLELRDNASTSTRRQAMRTAQKSTRPHEPERKKADLRHGRNARGHSSSTTAARTDLGQHRVRSYNACAVSAHLRPCSTDRCHPNLL